MSKKRRWPRALGALVVAGSICAVSCSRQQSLPRRAGAPRAPPTAKLMPAAPAPPTLAAAFAAAYPTATVEIAGQQVEFRPALLEHVGPDTFALLSGGQVGPPQAVGHVTFGYASVAYLAARPKLALVAKPLLINLSRGGFGAPPTIQELAGVSQTPTIDLLSSYGNQGTFDTSATLVTLGPTPRTIGVSDAIPIAHSAPGPCDIEGTIVPATLDKAFDIRFSGAYHGRERFVLTHGRWTPTGPEIDLTAFC
jgi:hypothetical protein